MIFAMRVAGRLILMTFTAVGGMNLMNLLLLCLEVGFEVSHR